MEDLRTGPEDIERGPSDEPYVNVAGVGISSPRIKVVGRWIWGGIAGLVTLIVGAFLYEYLHLASANLLITRGPSLTYDYSTARPSALRVVDSFRVTNRGVGSSFVQSCEITRIGLGEKAQPIQIFDRRRLRFMQSRDFGCVFDLQLSDVGGPQPWLIGVYAGDNHMVAHHQFTVIREGAGVQVVLSSDTAVGPHKGPDRKGKVNVQLVVNGAYDRLAIQEGDTFYYTWGAGMDATRCEFVSPDTSSVSVSGSGGPIGPGHPFYPQKGRPVLFVVWCTDGFDNARGQALVEIN